MISFHAEGLYRKGERQIIPLATENTEFIEKNLKALCG